jgi:hypothetical protein
MLVRKSTDLHQVKWEEDKNPNKPYAILLIIWGLLIFLILFTSYLLR